MIITLVGYKSRKHTHAKSDGGSNDLYFSMSPVILRSLPLISCHACMVVPVKTNSMCEIMQLSNSA